MIFDQLDESDEDKYKFKENDEEEQLNVENVMKKANEVVKKKSCTTTSTKT